jgi:hypothetical protein
MPGEGLQRVEPRGSIVAAGMAGIGASFPFPPAPAEVGYLN